MKDVYYKCSILEGLAMEYIKLKAHLHTNASDVIKILRYYNEYLSLNHPIIWKDIIDLNVNLKSCNTAQKCKVLIITELKRWESADKNNIDSQIEIILTANVLLIALLQQCDFNDAAIMASALHNYPDFVIGKYIPTLMDSYKFYKDYLTYYTKMTGKPFLEIFEEDFKSSHFYKNNLIKKRRMIMDSCLKYEGLPSYESYPEKVIFADNRHRALVLKERNYYTIVYESHYYFDGGEEQIYLNSSDFSGYWAPNNVGKSIIDTVENAEKIICENPDFRNEIL